MRKYQAIWVRLKLHKTATLIAAPSSHLKIIRAVKKEKNIDLAYKLTSIEQGLKFKLAFHSEGDKLNFRLSPVISMYNL